MEEFQSECDGQAFVIRISKQAPAGEWTVAVTVGELPEVTDDYTYQTVDEARAAGEEIGRGIIQDE